MSQEILDTAEAMENEATARDLPVGWLALVFGLIIWGAYYLWTYSPWSTGWTQAGELASTTGDASSNIGMTVLFTALPTLAAVGLYFMQRKAKR
jgi:hypothetical protein